MRSVVLIGVDWFLPAYKAGGPIRSVANLVALLAETHEVWVLTGAYDLGEANALPVALNTWVNQGPHVRVKHLTREAMGQGAWQEALAQAKPDFLYLNSVYSKPFALDALRAARSFPSVQVVLAPRGMLGAGALSIKPLKKRLFLAAARRLGWFKGVRWHASTDYEREEVQQWFPGASVVVAGNLPTPPPTENPPRPTDKWVIVNIGRIHKVKNTLFSLEAIRDADSGRPVALDFIGPAEDEAYMNELRKAALAAGPDVTIRFLGAIPPHELGAHLNRAHFLTSSTTQENFGHSIAEAWAHGCPVIIADTTPWRDLEAKGIGWDLPLQPEAWARGLAQALALEPAQWQALSDNARAFFRAQVWSPEVREANRRIFRA